MNTEPDETHSRHIREKSMIDHVARDLFKPPPEPAAEKSDKPKPTTDTGLSVEEQVRKEWDPSKGGCRRFCYRAPLLLGGLRWAWGSPEAGQFGRDVSPSGA